MSEKDKSSRKKWLKVILLVGALVVASLCIWYYSIPTESDILLNALESEDVVSYLQNNATSRNVIVELHKSMVLLQKKGYMSLYERVKKGA